MIDIPFPFLWLSLPLSLSSKSHPKNTQGEIQAQIRQVRKDREPSQQTEKRKRGTEKGREEEEMGARCGCRVPCGTDWWSLSLSLPPTLAKNWCSCTALQKMRARRIPHIFLPISSYFSLPPALWNPPPTSVSLLLLKCSPCTVMQNRCKAYCATWRFKAPQRFSHGWWDTDANADTELSACLNAAAKQQGDANISVRIRYVSLYRTDERVFSLRPAGVPPSAWQPDCHGNRITWSLRCYHGGPFFKNTALHHIHKQTHHKDYSSGAPDRHLKKKNVCAKDRFINANHTPNSVITLCSTKAIFWESNWTFLFLNTKEKKCHYASCQAVYSPSQWLLFSSYSARLYGFNSCVIAVNQTTNIYLTVELEIHFQSIGCTENPDCQRQSIKIKEVGISRL